MSAFFHEEHFENLNQIDKGEYENCIFKNCDFSDSDLSNFKFIGCHFMNSNLSLSKIYQTLFQKIHFSDCKLLGLNFNNCNDFSLSFIFENSQLNHSSFFKLKIKKTIFRNCQMKECDFTQTDFTESVFDNCNLEGAQFDFTNLEKTDFRTSFNFSLDPDQNKIKGAMFSKENVIGLLHKYNIKIES